MRDSGAAVGGGDGKKPNRGLSKQPPIIEIFQEAPSLPALSMNFYEIVNHAKGNDVSIKEYSHLLPSQD